MFTFVDPAAPFRQIDVFLEDPLPFAALHAQSILKHGEGYAVRIASLAHLLRMKQQIQPPRPQDSLDIHVGAETPRREGHMNEPAWTNEVRQEDWSLDMIFRWLEEAAAFLYQIKAQLHPPLSPASAGSTNQE